MQDIFGSVRRSLNFENNGVRLSGVVERIGSSIRKSRIGLFNPKPALPPPPTTRENDDGGEHAPPIRWRKGELIGCGAFGRVYMGMNLDSGELLAVKQVLIAPNAASREKTQAHIRELEEEVKLLKNLSHPNIVRYLGTVREEDSLNILLEFVPGGSISSLLGNFGSFPESVIRMYTKQLLLGLEYLHKNGIMHRDIKGANILVDNKGCIRLADFGASKKVVELATINGAKSMKGTPYWMAPEVILQTGHSFSADIWSVGCTVIEMATGKPPWSEQYQEVAALFHIGTTKSHPPIPEHLSPEANDFLLKCLQKEPHLRSSPTELLQHPFVTGKCREFQTSSCTVHMESSGNPAQTTLDLRKSNSSSMGLKDVCNLGSFRHSNVYPEGLSGVGSLWRPNNCDDDMCQLDDKIDVIVGDSVNVGSISHCDDLNKSFNPMCEPIDDWSCKIDEGPGMDKIGVNSSSCQSIHNTGSSSEASGKVENGFSFLSSSFAPEEDDELTESKIRAFLVEKALELKKLQTPLYEEFYNSSNVASCPSPVRSVQFDNIANMANLPPKSRSPSNLPSRRLSAAVEATRIASPVNYGRRVSMHDRALQEIQPHKRNERKEFSDCRQETIGLSASFTERQRKWKEELDEELERKRAMMRQVGLGGKISSPKHTILTRQRERLRFADSGR